MSNITKSKVEKWTLLRDDKSWLATFMFDNVAGEISIMSDYGEYAYLWSPRGRGTELLTQFLVKMNDEYIMNKFHGSDKEHFYLTDTIKQLKKDVLKARRSKKIGRDSARLCWNEIDEIDYYDPGSEVDYQIFLWKEGRFVFKYIYDECHAAVPCITGYPPKLVAFMKHCWAPFIEEIRNER